MLNVKDYLPIGSIVSLKGGNKKLMIFGIVQTVQDNEGAPIEYDYIGVPYPEGNLGTDYQYMFQSTEIEQVYFMGYNSAERQEFIRDLGEFYENRK